MVEVAASSFSLLALLPARFAPSTAGYFHSQGVIHAAQRTPGCTTAEAHIERTAEPGIGDTLPAARRTPAAVDARTLHAAAAASHSGFLLPEFVHTAGGRAAAPTEGLEFVRAVHIVRAATGRPGSRAVLLRTDPAAVGSLACRAVVARGRTGWSVPEWGFGRTVSSVRAVARLGACVVGKPGVGAFRMAGTRLGARSRCTLPESLNSNSRSSGSAATTGLSVLIRCILQGGRECCQASTYRVVRLAAKHVRNSAHHRPRQASRALLLCRLPAVVVLHRLAVAA